MLQLRKIIITTLVFGSSVVFSGSTTRLVGIIDSSIPDKKISSWDFGVQALYLKPDIDTINIRGIAVSNDGSKSYRNYDPPYNLGFKAEGTYHISKDHDISINGYHFAKTTKRTFVAITGNEGDFLSASSGTIQPNWTAINLEVGQHIRSSNTNSSMRIHVGIQYARIIVDEIAFVVLDDVSPTPNSKQINRTYNGIGPRFGIDLAHDWNNGFGIYGNVATALLTGTRSSTTEYIPNIFSARDTTATVIVPELETKLGVRYAHAVGPTHMIFDAGWMWISYVNATFNDNYNLVLNSASELSSASFGLQGPFIGFKWTV